MKEILHIFYFIQRDHFITAIFRKGGLLRNEKELASIIDVVATLPASDECLYLRWHSCNTIFEDDKHF